MSKVKTVPLRYKGKERNGWEYSYKVYASLEDVIADFTDEQIVAIVNRYTKSRASCGIIMKYARSLA